MEIVNGASINDFSVFLITKCFMLDVEGFLESPLHAFHQSCKSSQLMYLNVFKYKMLRFLQFQCKLNTRGIAKACSFRFFMIITVIPSMLCFPSFLTISYGFPWCLCMFPMVFLRFRPVFLQFPLSVFPPSPILDFVRKNTVFT